MSNKYLKLPYDSKVINFEDLSIDKASEFAKAIEIDNYSILIKCEILETNGDELIYFIIEPEIGQAPLVDIRYKEPILVQFKKNDIALPYVYSLREDFPYTSHLNAREFEKPRCLCLYETTYSELKHNWTGNAFLERIREWLSLTAQNKLHQTDQPLDPFILSTSGNLILPNRIDDLNKLYIYKTDQTNNIITLRAFKDKQDFADLNRFILLFAKSQPQTKSYLKICPTNLNELNNLLKDIGLDLIEEVLKPKLIDLIVSKKRRVDNIKLVLVINIPVKRNESDSSYYNDYTSFLLVNSILDTALKINAVDKRGGLISGIFPPIKHDENETKKIAVGALRTYWELNKKSASQYSGIGLNDNPKIAIIGAGALGSQVISSLNKMGFGEWIVLDNDILLPHNLVRHSLNSRHVGYSKSLMISNEGNLLLSDHQNVKYIHDDYLKQNNPNVIKDNFSEVDLIIDASASVAVERKLANDANFNTRRLSVFLNPQGSDLVMLLEPKSRNIKLDHIEMQYYRMIWQNEELHDHLLDNGLPIRYSASCRDITNTMKQEDMMIFAGICSKNIRQSYSQEEGSIILFMGNKTGEIRSFSNKLYMIKEVEINGWTIIIDDFLINKIKTFRTNKLPNETGGILIGSYDHFSKRIYIVDTILSPKDSKEYPMAYYRGIDGLEKQLLKLSICTAHNLYYIGEWHSHPDNCSVNRSKDDLILFEWIKNHMIKIGLKPLMLIVGDGNNLGIHLE